MVLTTPSFLANIRTSDRHPERTLFRSRSERRTRVLLLALLVTAAVLIPATSAAAHESLVAASPAEGETVTSEISEVTLTFSSEPLSGAEDASFVEVKAPNGRIVTSPTVIEEATMTAPVEAGGRGNYEVAWRFVSEDGHPITGVYAFEYAGSSTSATTAQPATPSPSASDAPQPSSPESFDETPVGALGPTGLILLILLVLVISWAAYARQTRSKP